MHAADCPAWEYTDHDNSEAVLPVRSNEILINLRRGIIDSRNSIKNTRALHSILFTDLTPDDCDYYAGNYRGSDNLCLKHYRVFIHSDPSVGVDPDAVQNVLEYFGEQIDSLFASLEAAALEPPEGLSKADRILYIVAAICNVFVEFLRIHPYANGNGHMGRYIVFAFLGKFGCWPKNWPFNDRPPEPYCEYIAKYRKGYPDPLEQFVLKCILGIA